MCKYRLRVNIWIIYKMVNKLSSMIKIIKNYSFKILNNKDKILMDQIILLIIVIILNNNKYL